MSLIFAENALQQKTVAYKNNNMTFAIFITLYSLTPCYFYFINFSYISGANNGFRCNKGNVLPLHFRQKRIVLPKQVLFFANERKNKASTAACYLQNYYAKIGGRRWES
ncbi:MAG: hypothetical protein SPI34_06135 [Opitutales bacterium]|nr:hypothetical protein [Opitutales bacterium]